MYLIDHVDTGGTDSLFLKFAELFLGCVYRRPLSIFIHYRTLFQNISELADNNDKLLVFGDFSMPDVVWPLNTSHVCGASFQLLVDLLLSSHLNQLVTEPIRYPSG